MMYEINLKKLIYALDSVCSDQNNVAGQPLDVNVSVGFV